MHIYYKDKQSVPFFEDQGRSLYTQYQETHLLGHAGSALYAYDFKTQSNHQLKVDYDANTYKMVFCFKGRSETFKGRQSRYAFEPNKVLMYHTQAETYTSLLQGNMDYKTVHLHVAPTLVDHIREQVPSLFGSETLQLPIPKTSYNLWASVQQIPKVSKCLQDLYLEKVLYEQIWACIELAEGLQNRTYAKQDQDKMYEALYILDHSPTYMSIAELSRQLGINTFKLKKLFREQLHTSVFEYQAMRQFYKAHELLLTSSISVQEVAMICGYESLGSFSNAFFKRFGYRPSDLKNS